MNGQEMRARLHEGGRIYDTMVSANSSWWPGAVKGTGVDFVFIDTEHIAQDRVGISWMCRTYAALGIVPVVRVPCPDPYQACMVYDAGAAGIIAPYIETPEQVKQLVGAARYRPLKGERLQRILHQEDVAEPALAAYLEERNARQVLIANIESVPALHVLDDILDVEGLDAVLVGPHDLTTSLGIPEDYRHPRYVEAVDTIIQKARARGVGAGIHATYPHALEHEIRWAEMGMNLIVHLADIIAFRNTMQRDLDLLKAALGDTGGPGEAKPINV